MPNLAEFYCSSCNIRATLDHLTQHAFENLTNIDLSSNQIYGSIPPIASWPQIEEISLMGNDLTGSYPLINASLVKHIGKAYTIEATQRTLLERMDITLT